MTIIFNSIHFQRRVYCIVAVRRKGWNYTVNNFFSISAVIYVENAH